jgi:hypothetical protein
MITMRNILCRPAKPTSFMGRFLKLFVSVMIVVTLAAALVRLIRDGNLDGTWDAVFFCMPYVALAVMVANVIYLLDELTLFLTTPRPTDEIMQLKRRVAELEQTRRPTATA